MAIDQRNNSFDAKFLSQSYTEGIGRIPGNSPPAFEFQVPRKILEERAKSWDSLFEKYSMEITDAVELNLETLKPETDLNNEYVPERRIPMRNPPACIQYWVDTGKPPCKAYADENYNSDIGSSLSESEPSAPLPAPSPPMKYTLPHPPQPANIPPQPANIPQEYIQRIPSVASSSSVNTREYILSATQFTSKKINLATMESLIDSRKVPEALVNIEDTYVDVCGTDELPRMAEEAHQNNSEPNCVTSQNIRGENFMSNSQLNELEKPLILGEIFKKNLSDEILRVTSGSLMIGDVIPSLQRIRDGPENYNVDDLYSDKLPSVSSEDVIEFSKYIPTPPPKIVEPVIPTRDLNRRKLFTNNVSPIELIKPLTHCPRKFSSSTDVHPALADFDVLHNQRQATVRRKKSLFRPKKKLQAIVEEDKETVRQEKSRENRKKGTEENEDERNSSSLEKAEKANEIRQDPRLKRKPVVKLERTSENLILRYSRQTASEKKKSKRDTFKAKSTKVEKEKDKETKIACIKTAVDDDFFTKKEIKLRDLVVSLERLPRIMLQKLVQTRKSKTDSTKSTSMKGPSDVLENNNFIGFNSSDINESLEKSEKKDSFFVERDEDEDETQNQNLCKKSSHVKKSFIKNIISLSSDEEDIFKVDEEEFPKLKDFLRNQGSDDENIVTNGVKIGTNLTPKSKNKNQNSSCKSNTKDQTSSFNSNNKEQISPLKSNDNSKISSFELKNNKHNSPLKFNKKYQTGEGKTWPLRLNTKPEIPRKSIKVVFTLSSDEDDDFTKIIKNSFAVRKAERKNFSKTCNDIGSKEIASNQVRSSCGSFSGQKLCINEFKTNNAFNKDTKTGETFGKPEFDARKKKAVNDATLNNLSAKLRTKTSEVGDNNLKEKCSTDDIDDEGNKEMENNKDKNQSANHNPFEIVNTRRISRLVLVSSGNSSDSDNNTALFKKKTKRLQQSSSKRESTKPRRSSKNNLNCAKIANEKPALESLEEETSDSSENSRQLLRNRPRPLVKSENQNLEKKMINKTEKAERIEAQKSLIVEGDSDSTCEWFDTLPMSQVSGKSKQEKKDQNPSKIKTSPEKFQNNHSPKSNLQTAKEIAKPLKRLSTFNNKRKKTVFGGSISSDSEDSQSELESMERHRVRKIGTFGNGENFIRILHQPKKIRREVEETSHDSSLNILGGDRSRDSSQNIFGSSKDSSDNESVLHLNFKNRVQNTKDNQKFVKNVGPGIKLQTFSTKSYWESDSE